jgi:cell fate (sporulation/competence/biofilm development) regulator YmcA (YheA/YmcA/DUF963 family)
MIKNLADQLAKGISMADGIKELKQYISRLEQSLEWSEEENSIMKKAATAMLLTKSELESQLQETNAKLDEILKKGEHNGRQHNARD